MSRTYRMKARAESAAVTRRRVLDAARAAILDGPTPTLSMGDVATRAGVARSTLYASFGSRTGLVGALMGDATLGAGFERVLQLFNLPNADEAMSKALPEGARMIGAGHALLKRIGLLAQLDSEVAAAYEVGQRERAGGMRYQAGRLAQQGLLRPGVNVEEAALVLWLLTDFGTFDSLHTTWGLDAEQIATFLESVASRHLLDNPAASEPDTPPGPQL